jgi:hypothetical protein
MLRWFYPDNLDNFSKENSYSSQVYAELFPSEKVQFLLQVYLYKVQFL